MFLHSFPRFAAHTTSSVSYDERHRRATFAYPPLGYQRNRAEATWLQLHGDFHTPNPELSCSGPRGHSDGLSSRLADHDTDDSNNINDSRPGLVSLYSIELIRLRTKDVCELLREPASVYTPARRTMMSLQLHTQDPSYPAMMQQYQQRAQALLLQQATQQRPASDAYAYTSNGLPVNTNQGAIRTESRSVFVSGLNYKARSKDVEALFSRAGEISKCEVQKDAASGRSKGKATIRYSSTASAQQAISMFNNRKFMDMALKVRLDTEQT
ncbi:hypothetical protein B0A54_07508 [Friedmanniomyces endolithicus]|uniref:RRM domain-containing protein n=1 Tax=Friedmanniomyces endolithicus TaxID=329885 RepID=A0A4U0V4L7_9PEZI|nr:hypothetical protein B0A54_07508 [Friedmanniomyces endolithicus]